MSQSLLDIILRTRKTGTGEKEATEGLKGTKQAIESFSDSVRKNATDLSGLRGQMDGWIANLKAATPQNIEYAERMNSITAAYQSGSLSASEAKSQMEQLRYEMASARPVSEKLVSSFKGAGLALGAMVAGVTALNSAFNEVKEFGKAGSVVLQTTESFDLLLKKVGAAPDLLDALRAASRNTVDDMTLMSSTATLLAGTQGELSTALANATPQLMEIAKAANKLNPLLGDTTYLYESIATGIKRQSPLILDNLGLTIKVGEANEKYARALGKSVEQLTAEEKQMALLNATLVAGSQLLEQVGNNTDAATDAIARMEATQRNAENAFKAKFAPAISQVVGVMGEANEESLKSGAIWTRLLPTLGGAVDAYLLIKNWLDKDTAALEENTDAVEENTAAVDANTNEARENIQTTDNVIRTQKTAADAMDAYSRRLQAQADAYKLTADYAEKLNQKYENLQTIVGGQFGKQLDETSSRLKELRDKSHELRLKIEELEQSEYLTAEQQSELEGLREELAETGNSIDELKARHEEAMKTMAFNMLMARAESDGLTENEVANLTRIAQAWDMWDEKTAEVVNAINENMALLDTENPRDILNILERILGLNPYKRIDVEVHYRTIGSPVGVVGMVGAEPTQRMEANARDFVVPPGFPNDSYLVGLSSGERVIVENERQRLTGQSKTSEKPTLQITGPVYINNGMDLEMISTYILDKWRREAV